jgi:hypothetical protein
MCGQHDLLGCLEKIKVDKFLRGAIQNLETKQYQFVEGRNRSV